MRALLCVKMLISVNLVIKKFDDRRWLVNTPEGRNVLINKETLGLLGILSNSSDYQQALEKFHKTFNEVITQEEFEALVQNRFKSLNILSNKERILHKQPSYLLLKVPLLNARLAGFLANPLRTLFLPSIFWSVFTCVFLLNSVATIYSFYSELLNITLVNVTLFTILLGSSMLVHELGHIAACRQFVIRHGAIGFGFYFIFPVVYADITQVWTATKPQRIIANAGGIYLELIYGSILFLIFVITRDITFLLSAVAIFVKAITELNPFIRYDGYWLLADITNTPNLIKKSNNALKNFFLIKNFKIHLINLLHLRWEVSKRDSFLLSYGLANTLLLGIYITYVLVNFHVGIIHFPELLFSLLQKAINLKLSLGDFPHGFLWILGLYILVFKIVIQLIAKQVKEISYYFSYQKLDRYWRVWKK